MRATAYGLHVPSAEQVDAALHGVRHLRQLDRDLDLDLDVPFILLRGDIENKNRLLVAVQSFEARCQARRQSLSERTLIRRPLGIPRRHPRLPRHFASFQTFGLSLSLHFMTARVRQH